MTTDVAATPTVATADVAPRARSWLEVAGVLALVALGAATRAHGFTSLDLWFDDAWAAMPARVGVHAAAHMVLTAPGYGLVLRSWIRVDPATTWWAQLPAFILGLAAIPSVYALVRWMKNPRWLAFAAATVVTVSPLAVQYATRVKEYPFDLLAACLLLALAERARRAPGVGTLAALGVASAVTFFTSAGVAPVLVGVWVAVLLAIARRRELRGVLATWLGIAVVAVLAVWLVFLRTLPAVLSRNWRRRGFLVDYRSLPLAERSVSLIFGGFLHALFAYPVPVTYFRGTAGLHAPGALAVGLVVVCVAIGVPVVASWRGRAPTAELAGAVTLLVAVLLAVADRVPLGDGRTDEVLYPALLVCLAAAVRPIAERVARAVRGRGSRTAIAWSLAVVLLAATGAFGASHRAVYPTLSLRDVAARLHQLEGARDVVFVDTFNSFGWCYYGLSPCAVKVGGVPVWPQGFRPVATRPSSTFIARHYGIPQPEFAKAQRHAGRIWYVGYTFGTFDVGANPALYRFPVPTYMTGLLSRYGWVQAPATKATRVYAVHAYAVLYVRRT
jgi:hypothetical protein